MASSQKNTILIIDDQSLARTLLKQMLVADGYDVIEAESGEQALVIARDTHIDGVVLDLRMPGIGGLETCRRFRSSDRYKVTPILFVTASTESEALAEAFEAGCDDFIPKPIDSTVLHTRLKGHMQRAALYHRLEGVQRNLNRYLSPRTQQMVEHYSSTGMLPPPEALEVCVLFTDIRGFTQLSQTIEPEKLFSLLSDNLAYQVDLVYQYGGYVDKYAGDGIMAVFEDVDMAWRGCQCALDIIAHARYTGSDERKPIFAMGCGIHKGHAVIGNIGSPEHLDYSVIGESVNLAARLCGFADPMSVIVSDAVYRAVNKVPRFRFSSERRVEIKGFKEAVAVYNLAPADGCDDRDKGGGNPPEPA